ncbi:unnamed protein product [Boreogadus saida]
MSATVLLAYYLECTDLFGVHVQGFFCHDPELLKPYPGSDEVSFVPPLLLYCVVAATPTAIGFIPPRHRASSKALSNLSSKSHQTQLLPRNPEGMASSSMVLSVEAAVPSDIASEILVGEVCMYVMRSTRDALLVQERTIVTGDCCYLNPLVRRIIRFIGVFAFGLFATDIFVNAGQVVTGGLSPYFLSICKPNYTGADCRLHQQFVAHGNVCTGSAALVERARRSFPSKDAALSVYAAVYLTEAQDPVTKGGVEPEVPELHSELWDRDRDRDLSVLLSSDRSWSPHIEQTVQSGRKMASWVLSVFRDRSPFIMMTLYKAMMYITSTIRTKSSRLAKPVLCLVTLCSAFLTGLNRVSEYRNHCSDVLAGFVLGTAVALFLVRLHSTSQGSGSDKVTVKGSLLYFI